VKTSDTWNKAERTRDTVAMFETLNSCYLSEENARQSWRKREKKTKDAMDSNSISVTWIVKQVIYTSYLQVFTVFYYWRTLHRVVFARQKYRCWYSILEKELFVYLKIGKLQKSTIMLFIALEYSLSDNPECSFIFNLD